MELKGKENDTSSKKMNPARFHFILEQRSSGQQHDAELRSEASHTGDAQRNHIEPASEDTDTENAQRISMDLQNQESDTGTPERNDTKGITRRCRATRVTPRLWRTMTWSWPKCQQDT